MADRNAEFVALQAEFWLHAVRNPEFMAAIARQLREQAGVLDGWSARPWSSAAGRSLGLRSGR